MASASEIIRLFYPFTVLIGSCSNTGVGTDMLTLLAATAIALQTPRYERRAAHDPDGTGTFYMGREIARFMSHEAAGWLDRPERDQEEAPRRLIATLGLKPGMVVADIGAGSGYLSFPMARAVGPRGKVLAVDIQPEMLAIIREKARKGGAKERADDPRHRGRPEGAREQRRPDAARRRLPRAGAPVRDDPQHDPRAEEGRSACAGGVPEGGPERADQGAPQDVPAQVKREMAIHPLRFVKSVASLPRQHVLIFAKR